MFPFNEKNHKLFTMPEIASLPVREEIEEKYKWNLSDIYSTEEEWEKDFQWVEDNLDGYKKFIGKLSDSSETLLACFKDRKSVV